jgi:alpha-D-ribose 1-methylphosphonate 5-triphosphate diphosphatase
MKQNNESLIVENGRLVLPDGIHDETAIRIEGGLITKIGNGQARAGAKKIDAAGRYVIPGIIDLHSDALEKELEPRPNTLFPTDMVLLEIDKKLAACGITTMYHSISFAESEIGVRSNRMAESIIREINHLSPMLRVRTKVHARYEMTDEAAVPVLEKLIEENMINLFSFMNHTPGQGQFRDDASFHRYYRAVYQKTEGEITNIIKRKVASQKDIRQRLNYLIELCRNWNIPMASHDDDSEEKVTWLKQNGISISEFPVNMEAVLAANRNNLHVCLGAPNALRGHSQSKNLSAREAIAKSLCHVLCSDYSPMTMLHGAFKLADAHILLLHEAIRLVTINPARAVGVDHDRGSLAEGKAADFIIVDKQNSHAQVLKTFVAGQEVFSTCLK